jgi:hypothetical protein
LTNKTDHKQTPSAEQAPRATRREEGGMMKTLSDPIQESEVKIQLHWTADKRTTRALERQASLMGFATPADYLHQLIAATLAGNEADTYVLEDGTLTA